MAKEAIAVVPLEVQNRRHAPRFLKGHAQFSAALGGTRHECLSFPTGAARMRKPSVILIAAALPLVATAAVAQVAPKGTGFKAEYLAELTVAEDHLVRLAEVIPADKYTWRPAVGVRSFSEVFLHVAGSNFNLPRTLGVVPKEGMLTRDYWTSTTDKAKIVADLKQSFVFLRAGIEKLTDADAEKKMPRFDGETPTAAFCTFSPDIPASIPVS